MTNIILILLALHFLRTIKYKIKYTTLNCGIFAWAGKEAKKFDKAKFDIQGLYNNTRGGDSCGVSTDGEIYYGINTSKNYGNFLVDSNYNIPNLIPTVIGHTRKSSSGSVNAHNAHPFGFGDYNDSFEFIGVHNGTLHNQTELAKKYNVETSVYKFNQYSQWVYDRMKIDSEILLEIIYSNKNFNVLSDYVGGAALLFTNTLEPNVLYAFRGASKLEKNGVTTEIDERPLFYYIENKNSVYISSMEESLVAIGGEANQTLFKLDENTIYKIVDGDIENAEKILISREDAHQRAYVSYANTTNWVAKDKSNKKKNKNDNDNDNLMNIRSEKIEKFYPSDIYMQKLRYYRNGHLITGIYTYINNYGFFRLCEKVDDIIKESETLIGRHFNIASGYFVPKGTQVVMSKAILLPFPERQPPVFYIYEGVLLETELDYVTLAGNRNYFSTEQISEMSKHPIINIYTTLATIDKQNIMYKGKLYTGNISPIGVDKIYYIEDGNLISTKRINIAAEVIDEKNIVKNSTPAVGTSLLPINTGNTSKNQTSFIDELIAEQIEKQNADCCEISNDPDYGRKEVEDLMLPIYMKVQEANTKLEEFKSNSIIKNIIDTNTDYLTTLDEDIEKSYLK